MKITKRQLRRIIKEALDPAVQKELDDVRKYRTKGEWRLRMPGTDQYLIPGWRSGERMEIESFLGDKAEAKIFDNELNAEVDRDRIAKDPANATAGRLEVEGAPHGR